MEHWHTGALNAGVTTAIRLNAQIKIVILFMVFSHSWFSMDDATPPSASPIRA
jgi:hypothetical protein